MDQSYLNFLDQATTKQNEAKSYLDSLPTERQAGVDKLKTDQGYAEKQTAVDSATKTLYETQKRLDALPKQAGQRMAGRNVTQGQLDRIIGAESQPLSQQYKSAGLGREQAGQSLSLVDQAIKDYTNQYNQDANQKYQATLDQASGLFNQYQAGSGEYWKQMELQMQREQQAEAQRQAQMQMAMRQQELNASLANQKYQQSQQTKGTTSAYIQDQQDRAAQMAVAAGKIPGTAEYNKLYTETLKNALYQNEPTYGDMGLDMNTIYQTRGGLDKQLEEMYKTMGLGDGSPAMTRPEFDKLPKNEVMTYDQYQKSKGR